MSRMPELLGIARNAGELAPYLVVMGLGFLVGAWGQSAKVPVAVVAGLLMILLSVGAFVLEHSSGSGSGVPGIPGV
jgi:hypothetical protein